MTTRVYTIGYGKRTLADVCDLLSQYHIEYLIDVRSIPISRFQPEFSRDALEPKINRAGLRYVFMGNLLGGRPSDQTCYTGGRVDYEKLKTLNTYKQGIRRLDDAWNKGFNVCLLCSELNPQDCHRSKLVGVSLAERQIPVYHICETGDLKSQEQIVEILTTQSSMFEHSFMSRNSYTSNGRRKA
jgi:uncharacterized protein (DUF488 family)